MKKLCRILLTILMIYSCQEQKQKEENTSNISHSNSQFDTSPFIGKDYLIDNQHSYVGFKIKYFGFSPVRGRFDEFEGSVFYNENDVTDLSLSVNVDVNSLNTGNKQRDEDLTSFDGWFNTLKYPKILFRSKGVVPLDNGAFNLVGDFTMKGVTKEIEILFKKPTQISIDFSSNEQVDYSGSVVINRKDYGVEGDGFWNSVMENGLTQLSNEVEIELDIHTRRPDYLQRYKGLESTDIRKRLLDIVRNEGIQQALDTLEKENISSKISSGALSTIAYTLNFLEMYDEAEIIFRKRLELYPEKKSTYSQLGITKLFKGNVEAARTHFKKTLEMDSLDTRATEYLKLIVKSKPE